MEPVYFQLSSFLSLFLSISSSLFRLKVHECLHPVQAPGNLHVNIGDLDTACIGTTKFKLRFFIMDEKRSRDVLEAFVKLHEEDLIYNG
ncbi:hypothetical protein AgCh_009160 [Apium graveolens]